MSERPRSRVQASDRATERVPEQAAYTNRQYIKATLALPLLIALVVLILVGTAVLAVAAGVGLDALSEWLAGACFSGAPEAGTIGESLHCIRYIIIALSGAAMGVALLLFATCATNESAYHAARLNLKAGGAALVLSMTVDPVLGFVGCVAL